MEMFATLLCMFSMFAGIFFLIAMIINKIRKKPKKKLYSRGLLMSVIVFIASIVLFAVFETPESKARYEQQRLEEQAQKEKEQAEKEAEKKAKEQAKKEAQKKEETKKNSIDKSESKEDSSKNTTNTKKLEDVELNYLKQLKIRENPVMNGGKTEKIGTYGFIKAEKELASEVTEQEYIDFCNDCVRDSGYNWFTIDFGDGTGIVFSGSLPETGTYGEIDEERCLTTTIKYITINEDKTVSLSDPTTY